MAEKKEHPQATLLRWVADNEEIQYYHHKKGTWGNVSAEAVLKSIVNMQYEVASTKYRIKPKTIRIGKYAVAEPMKDAPAIGSLYFVLSAVTYDGINTYRWDGGSSDKNAIINGAWSKKGDALLAAKAIKELLTGQ